MSTKKRTLTEKVITFYYDTETIMQNVHAISSMKAKYLEDFEKAVLSPDESDFFNKRMKKVTEAIFSIFDKVKTTKVNHNTGLVLDDTAYTTSGNFITGKEYTIREPGNTNFTLIGASSSDEGTSFIATGPGTGNGSAFNTPFCTWVNIKDNELVKDSILDEIDLLIAETIASFILSEWAININDDISYKTHITDFNAGLLRIEDKSKILRYLV